MNAPEILPIYAALLALLFFALSVRTLRLRRQLKIGLGDEGNRRMLRAIRVHSNFAEYVPMSLVLILLVELRGTSVWAVHALCIGLLFGRIVHAFGVSQDAEKFAFRIVGIALTFTCIVSSALIILASSVL